MSTPTNIDIERLRERVEDSHNRISRMCEEGRPPRMSIPARPDHDDDLVISKLLNDLLSASEENHRLYLEARTESEALRTENARWTTSFGHEALTEALAILDQAGMGKPGTPNTLLAMVEQVCDELAKERESVAELERNRIPAIPAPGCNYLQRAEYQCNKCGKVHSMRDVTFAFEKLTAAEQRERKLRQAVVSFIGWVERPLDDQSQTLKGVLEKAWQALSTQPAPSAEGVAGWQQVQQQARKPSVGHSSTELGRSPHT